MSAEEPRKLRRVVHPDRTRASVRRGPVEKRRCSSCEQITEKLTRRYAPRHDGALWLCEKCERKCEDRGWLE